MLHQDKNERLSIEEILDHPWMKQTNEEDEEDKEEEEVFEKVVEETKTNKTKIIKKLKTKPKPEPNFKNLRSQQKKKSPKMGVSDKKEE